VLCPVYGGFYDSILLFRSIAKEKSFLFFFVLFLGLSPLVVFFLFLKGVRGGLLAPSDGLGLRVSQQSNELLLGQLVAEATNSISLLAELLVGVLCLSDGALVGTCPREEHRVARREFNETRKVLELLDTFQLSVVISLSMKKELGSKRHLSCVC